MVNVINKKTSPILEFKSNYFDLTDRERSGKSKVYGEALHLWLESEFRNLGYQIFEPLFENVGWILRVAKQSRQTPMILCSNIDHAGEGMGFDFSSTGMNAHGGPHIDILGENLQHNFRSMCRGMQRIDLFAEGFLEGMLE